MFSEIPNKVRSAEVDNGRDVWPEMGDKCEMNRFYRTYESAEGWLGKGYLSIWSPGEIAEFGPAIRETFPPNYHFFASDGGGTQFALVFSGGKTRYFSAPEIGSVEDIRVLGEWDEFIDRVKKNDYI